MPPALDIRNAHYTLLKFKDHPDFDDYCSDYQKHILDTCKYSEDWNELMATSRNVLTLRELPEKLRNPITEAILSFDKDELLKALVKAIDWHNWRTSIKLRKRVK